MNGELTTDQVHRLQEAYTSLRELAAECADVPSVTVALRAAAVELRTALYHQSLEFDFYGEAERVSGAEELRRGRTAS